MRPVCDDTTELMTLPRAAIRAGVGVKALRKAVKQAELPTFQIGTWPRVRWAEVLRWIDRQRVPTTAHAKRRVDEVLAGRSGNRRK